MNNDSNGNRLAPVLKGMTKEQRALFLLRYAIAYGKAYRWDKKRHCRVRITPKGKA